MVNFILVLIAGYSVTLQGVPNQAYTYRTGWYNKQVVQYVPLAASDPALAEELSPISNGPLTFVLWTPALNCTLDKDVLGDVYFIDSAQTTVFSTEPGQADYTPLWRVHYLQWRPQAIKTPINSQALVLEALSEGRLVQVAPVSVLDATIVMNSKGQIIKQAAAWNVGGKKIVVLPGFLLYYGAPNTYGGWSNFIGPVLITESSDQDMANRVGAYYVPRLRNAAACTNNIYAFANPAYPLPPAQLPVLETAPFTGMPLNEWNTKYSPLERWNLMGRGTLVPQATIKDAFMMLYLLNKGVINMLPTTDPVVTNSPVGIRALSG